MLQSQTVVSESIIPYNNNKQHEVSSQDLTVVISLQTHTQTWNNKIQHKVRDNLKKYSPPRASEALRIYVMRKRFEQRKERLTERKRASIAADRSNRRRSLKMTVQ